PVLYSDPRSDESNDYYWKLIRSAERAAKVRNEVRAAILRTQAARVAPAALTHSTRAAGHADLQRLTQRLPVAPKPHDQQAAAWQNDLLSLLDKSDQDFRTSEAGLLYDLQTACVDHEREIYALDVIEWALSGGKRPIKRPLPRQRIVRLTRHLRSASQRLPQ